MVVRIDAEWDPEWTPHAESLWVEGLHAVLAAILVLCLYAVVAYTLGGKQ